MKHSVCMFAVAVAASALFFGCSKGDANKDILSSAKGAMPQLAFKSNNGTMLKRRAMLHAIQPQEV